MVSFSSHVFFVVTHENKWTINVELTTVDWSVELMQLCGKSSTLSVSLGFVLNCNADSGSTNTCIMCVLCWRREWCKLQPVPEPGAAEGLAEGLSGELQAQRRTWGHCYRGRSYAALHSSLQILTGKCLLPPTLLKCWNMSLCSASTLWKDFGKWQISQQLFPFHKFWSWRDSNISILWD